MVDVLPMGGEPDFPRAPRTPPYAPIHSTKRPRSRNDSPASRAGSIHPFETTSPAKKLVKVVIDDGIEVVELLETDLAGFSDADLVFPESSEEPLSDTDDVDEDESVDEYLEHGEEDDDSDNDEPAIEQNRSLGVPGRPTLVKDEDELDDDDSDSEEEQVNDDDDDDNDDSDDSESEEEQNDDDDDDYNDDEEIDAPIRASLRAPLSPARRTPDDNNAGEEDDQESEDEDEDDDASDEDADEEETASDISQRDANGLARELSGLRCSEEQELKFEEARQRRHRDKRRDSRVFKRSHSMSAKSESGNVDDDAMDDQDCVVAQRRLRRRTRGPGDTDPADLEQLHRTVAELTHHLSMSYRPGVLVAPRPGRQI